MLWTRGWLHLHIVVVVAIRQDQSARFSFLCYTVLYVYKSCSAPNNATSQSHSHGRILNPKSAERRWCGRAAARRRRCGAGWRPPPPAACCWTVGWPRSWRPTAPTSTIRSGAPTASSPPRTSSARQPHQSPTTLHSPVSLDPIPFNCRVAPHRSLTRFTTPLSPGPEQISII
jgi:hypothetical protein